MPRIQPQNLTPSELVHYAELYNENGLPRHWCQELIATLDAYVTKHGDADIAPRIEQASLF